MAESCYRRLLGCFFCNLSYRTSAKGCSTLNRLRGPRARVEWPDFPVAQLYNLLAEDNAVIVPTLDVNYISHFVLAGQKRT